MTYKIVSTNKKLVDKIVPILNSLNMNESIHIQEVDIWVVDVNNIDQDSLLSYKNKIHFTNILFIVNNSENITMCLDNSFVHYIHVSFSKEELISWCKYFIKNKKEKILQLDNMTYIDLDKSIIVQNKKTINLTQQEKSLIKELSSLNFIKTNSLANLLRVNSTTTIRTIINRIRKKLDFDIFEQNKNFGYKLKNREKEEQKVFYKTTVTQIEEENSFIQNIIDSSPIFIVTFVHKQLYCINKSFREYLGVDIVKELWKEENGDFFQLIVHNLNETEKLKQTLFRKGKHKIKLHETNKKKRLFEIETFYFENLDKHLFIFH